MMDLIELAERVEAGVGEDRALDELVRAWETGATIEWQEHKKANAYHRDGSWVSIGPIEPVTTSLDAAIALLGRVLPGVEWGAYTSPRDPARPFHGFVEKPGIELVAYGASSPARALLAATLRALADASNQKGSQP